MILVTQILLLLALTLSAAAQEFLQLESETSGCFLPRIKKVIRWELRGGRYTSHDSAVVLSVDQVARFRRELLALPLDNGPPDWDQFDPEVRREAYRKLTEDYGLRPELKDLTAGLVARPSSRLGRSLVWLGGTEWTLSFSGAYPLKLTASGDQRPVPMICLEQGSKKWDAFSYKALDFLRVLEGKAPGAELEFYLVGDEGRWKALQTLQNQPRFGDWEELFRIEQADSATIPRYILDLAPRHPSFIDKIYWRAQELDSQLCLSTYNDCLARLERISWVKNWKSASVNRTVELRLGDSYDGHEWERAGLSGHKTHELELRAPDGQRTKLLLGDETDLSLAISTSTHSGAPQHWLDNLDLRSGQVATIANDGTVTRLLLR